MVTEILTETTHDDVSQMIASRTERGLDLYLTRRALITHLGGDTFTVPSCTGGGSYTVHYGGEVEDCTCTDFGVHAGEVACKHLTAVGIMHASRRSGVREVRIIAAACGDPFSYAGKTGTCAGCGHRFGHRDLVEVLEEDHLTFYEGDVVCETCAANHSVAR